MKADHSFCEVLFGGKLSRLSSAVGFSASFSGRGSICQARGDDQAKALSKARGKVLEHYLDSECSSRVVGFLSEVFLHSRYCLLSLTPAVKIRDLPVERIASIPSIAQQACPERKDVKLSLSIEPVDESAFFDLFRETHIHEIFGLGAAGFGIAERIQNGLHSGCVRNRILAQAP